MLRFQLYQLLHHEEVKMTTFLHMHAKMLVVTGFFHLAWHRWSTQSRNPTKRDKLTDLSSFFEVTSAECTGEKRRK